MVDQPNLYSNHLNRLGISRLYEVIQNHRASPFELCLLTQQTVQQLLARHSKFLDMCQETKTVSFLAAVCQLSHANSELASHSWIELFPRIWKVLSDHQQQKLAAELIPFLCSGSHVVQKDVQPSACKVCTMMKFQSTFQSSQTSKSIDFDSPSKLQIFNIYVLIDLSYQNM